MKPEEFEAAFDKQAPGCERPWATLAPIRDALHFLIDAVFTRLFDTPVRFDDAALMHAWLARKGK